MYNKKEDLKEILREMEEKHHELIGIDLSENSFAPECILLLVQRLSEMPQLESITLKGIFTQRNKEEVEESLMYIVEYLSKLKKIIYFNISDNALSMHGMKILVPLIEEMDTLQHLILNNNGIGRDGGEYLSEGLRNLSKKSSSLQSIEVGRNRLEDSAEKIGKSLSLFPYLDNVKIFQNSVDSLSLGEFLMSLSSLPIRVLNIADNFLLEHGSMILSECLGKWNIEVLSVADCLMGDKGMEELPKKMVRKARISGELIPQKEIDLSYNEISSSSYEAILQLIEKVSSCSLVLTGNEISSKYISEISQELERSGGDLVMEDESDILFSSEHVDKEEEPIEDILILKDQFAEISLREKKEPAEVKE
ncbi:Ran GTPase-activating protein 1 [Nematocida sp. LUAm3]|nr:Ran GTPase-activating protein 1 [Nematocida sp. LUAm3]KAI5173514.1 Ran GTPase-activating protein 1 [Nematocida sp. LUAm2]KAI5176735.1 Ran GTPase-activating protein 1 [Nematocida sp. LUAm1]